MRHKGLVFGVVGGFCVIAGLYAWSNGAFRPNPATRGAGAMGAAVSGEPFRVGFLPVTCHLTCPVTDWINKSMSGGSFFQPQRFNAWPELKEAHLAGQLPATFMIAPMALKLREQGVPLRIVYLGHRDGTALVVHKDSAARSLADLRGQRIAIPNRMSNQYLLLFKGLKDAGMTLTDVKFVEMPPPDMPAALATKSVDAIIAGEPFMAQAELDGYGRVLHQAKELWPNFISCVLVVEERQIAEQPARVQELVSGIARSGKWLEDGMDNRMAASDAVAKNYYNQDPRLLGFVLSKPPDRVTYGNLRLAKSDFDQIEALAIEAGLLDRPVGFDQYADPQFSEQTHGAVPYEWRPASSSSSSSSSSSPASAAPQPRAGALP